MKVRMGETIRAVCFNVNGLKDENKRRMIVEGCMKGRVDVLGLSETHLSGMGAGECGMCHDPTSFTTALQASIPLTRGTRPNHQLGKSRLVQTTDYSTNEKTTSEPMGGHKRQLSLCSPSLHQKFCGRCLLSSSAVST